MRRRDFILTAAGGAIASTGIDRAWADGAGAPLPKPASKPVLTVSGKITVTNVGNTAEFDMPGLEGLGLTSFTTTTPWTTGVTKFSGVLLATLMNRVGADGKTVVAYALNDYSAEVPISDFAAYGTLLATRMDGKYMPISDKGPLFIVYPFDSRPKLERQTFYGRSVWQLNRMIIV